MKKFKINYDNKRMKHLIDESLIDIMKIADKNENFNKSNIEEITRIFDKLISALNNIDNNITKSKIESTGDIILNQLIKELSIDVNNFSSNKVREFVIDSMDNVSKSQDLYTDAIVSLYTINSLCTKYLSNTKVDISGEDFTEKKIF